MIAWEEGVRDTTRLTALERSGLVGTGPEDAFDRLTELAAQLTGVPRACITLVDATLYTYKSTVGVPEGAPQCGRVEDSFCRYVVGSSTPLVVVDTSTDERTLDNLAIELNNIGAWAGYPIQGDGGAVLGTFCLIDTQPYEWTDTDLYVLATLAKAASSEIELIRAHAVIASARQEVVALLAESGGGRTSLTQEGHDPHAAAVMDGIEQLARNVYQALGGDLAR